MQDDEKMHAELLQELSDCREDERNTANQMLSVIGTAGAVLGAILTANIFSPEKNGLLRASFVLSNLIFCTAFSYAVTLGISAVMRYHYIRELEDRIHRMHQNGSGQSTDDGFVHWMSYSGAFVTRNYKHIKGVNGWFYFVAYTIATLCASVFCGGVTISLFLKLGDNRKIMDYAFLALSILVTLLTVIAFWVTSAKAGPESKLCFATARARREEREKPTKEDKKKTWITPRLLLYLFYPKTKDLQKPMLIPLGYFLYTLWTVNSADLERNFEALKNGVFSLLWAMFIFDFLFYQARYQINDLRGLDEDMQKEKTPIPGIKDADEVARVCIVYASLTTVLLRILGGGVALWFAPVKNKSGLWICTGCCKIQSCFRPTGSNNVHDSGGFFEEPSNKLQQRPRKLCTVLVTALF